MKLANAEKIAEKISAHQLRRKIQLDGNEYPILNRPVVSKY